MTYITRRTLLGSAALGGSLLALPACATQSAGRGFAANAKIRLAFLGLRGRGNDLLGAFRKVPDVSVAALCDVDPAVLQERLTQARALGERPQTAADPRRVFDAQDIDAVVIATPNHTHAALAIAAMQAGKHVYVEKPVSHDLHEGQILVRAARHFEKIVQAGTQNRSDTALRPAFAALHAGEFGAVRAIHGICYRDRKGIGIRSAPLTPPSGLDYDLWLGPAQDLPILRDSFHYDWHWCWNTGNGDVGNQGPHELDMICWALGDPGLPQAAFALGGRLVWGDAGETPNLMAAFFRFAGDIPVCFEVRNLVSKLRTDYHGLAATGIVVTTEHGELRAQRGGAVFVDRAGKTTRTWKGDSGATHQDNFVAALRAGDRSVLRSEVELAAKSAALAHLANAAYRLGSPGSLADARASCGVLPGLLEHVELMATNLAGHQIAAGSQALTIGQPLEFSAERAIWVGGDANRVAELVTPVRRKGHELPAVGAPGL